MSLDLFAKSDYSASQNIPLAERVRPDNLEKLIGHPILLAADSMLMKALEQKRLFSFILWGPPGIGKTSLAKLISKHYQAHFISLSAVQAGVKDLREAIEKAEINRNRYDQITILFIDEIHRFNRSQQDSLLHAVENGLIILIGATTENPSFELNPALLSRTRVFHLNSLTNEQLKIIIDNALNSDLDLKKYNITFEDENLLYHLSGGDARKALSLLESSFYLAKKPEQNNVLISTKDLLQSAESQKSAYDKKNEHHYDTISAYIKSIRGSDPDAAILWLARMLDGGEDVIFIARRLIILASEDIGNADPAALNLAVSAMQAVKVLGMPESRIILAQATTYLASTVKSNASYVAINNALADIKENPLITVPLHLRNGVTSLMKNENYGKGYLYAHDFEHNFVKQDFFPKEIPEKIFYNPTENGREKNIKERLKYLWNRLK
jgi:putative ATPase